MKKYIGKRIISFLIVLVGVSILSFLLIAWSGKDPAEIIAHRGVTHDFATALQLGGNMLVMKEGKIIESGEVQSVFDHTTEPYTRSLIEAYSLSCAFTKGAES